MSSHVDAECYLEVRQQNDLVMDNNEILIEIYG